MRNVRIDTEDGAQETLFSWAAWQQNKWPELELLYHVPNGGKRDKATAAKLKGQGVKPGVPDLALPVAKCGYHGLFIELKVGRNKTTALQDRWLENLREQGYYTKVCYGWEEARDTLVEYLEEKTQRREGEK